jgi:TM2 domain-containing membrane protein YozV
MKSKTVAYLLWFFFGLWGFHKFYLGKVGIGILYLFTFGLFFIGWFIDLFTLGTQVDTYNALLLGRTNATNNTNTNTNNIVVNIPGHLQSNPLNVSDQLHKLAELRDKGILTEGEFNTQKAKLLS